MRAPQAKSPDGAQGAGYVLTNREQSRTKHEQRTTNLPTGEPQATNHEPKIPEPWHAEAQDHELNKAAFQFGGRGV